MMKELMMNEDDFDVEDHDDLEKREVELELGTKSWVENEVARQERSGPTVSTMELNSFLLPRPDSRLNSFLELEEGAALQEMWGVGAFGSDFGESLRRESQVTKECSKCVQTAETVKNKEEELASMNAAIEGANKTLQTAEKTKKYLRDLAKKKEKENEEITLCWQTDVETSNTEITKLTTQLQVQKDMVLALKTEREGKVAEDNETEEGEVPRKSKAVVEDKDEDEDEDTVEVLETKKFNCYLCSFGTNISKQLKRHKWRSHSVWDCSMCNHSSNKLEEREQHLQKHREELNRIDRRCDCCKKTFKSKDDVVKHKKNDCKCTTCKELYARLEMVKEVPEVQKEQ